MKMKRSFGDHLFTKLNTVFMIMFAVICVYPFIYVAAISFNDSLDAQRGGIFLWPRVFSVENYRALFQTATIVRAYGITIARVLLSILSQLFFNTLFAYAMTHKDFVFRKFLKWWIFIPMYFSGGLIPYYLIILYTGLMNNFLVYIIPVAFSSFYIILLMTTIKGIPPSLIETAEMDGAAHPIILGKVILPLIKPTLAAIALFSGVAAWNDWWFGFTFISNYDLWPVQNVLLFLQQSSEAANLAMMARLQQGEVTITVTAQSIQMAMIIVATVPVLLIYPFLQRYFVKGVMIGSIKE